MTSLLKFSLIPLFLHALTSQAALTVTNIAAGNGANHSLFITSDGSLWTMGENQYGQLGDGSFNNTNRPLQIVNGVVTPIAGSGLSCSSKPTAACGGWGGVIRTNLATAPGDHPHPISPEQILVNSM